MKAAVYCRISRDRFAEALGVDRQEQDARALCHTRGWDDVEVYVDNDITASRRAGKRKTRPAYNRMFDDVKNGLVDAVVAWDFDRLFRDPLEQEEFFLMCERRGLVRVVTIGDDVDIDSGQGLLVARIKAAVAAEEVRKISQRGKRKHLELALAGKNSGGGRPYGYRDRFTLEPVEAANVREAVARLLAGETLRSVCADWNRRGIPSRNGVNWSTVVLKRMVCAGRICGWREHHGELVTVAEWPAIVDRSSVETLRSILRDPSRRTTTAPRRYVLSGGLVRCVACGAGMVSRPRDDGTRRYICANGPNFHGCGKTYIYAEWVEEWVTDLLFLRVDSPDYAQRVNAHLHVVADDPRDEIAACEAKLDTLAREWASDGLTRAEWLTARKAVQERLDAARRRLSRSTAPVVAPGDGDGLRGRWGAMTVEQRHAVFVAIVDRIDIGPAIRGNNKFQPERISVTWKV